MIASQPTSTSQLPPCLVAFTPVTPAASQLPGGLHGLAGAGESSCSLWVPSILQEQ